MNDTQKAIFLMEKMSLTTMSENFKSWLSNYNTSEKPLLESFINLLEMEYDARCERLAQIRLNTSGIPICKTIEDFDLNWTSGISHKKLNELSSLDFIEQKENIILLGSSGLGKTHLLLALGHKACYKGYSVYYMNCSEAVDILIKARNTGKLKPKLKWFSNLNLLLIDEIGYENLNPEQAGLFFQLINCRYEKGSVILTTNRAFGTWGELIGDDALATATLDRIVHHAHIITLKGNSYRMKGKL